MHLMNDRGKRKNTCLSTNIFVTLKYVFKNLWSRLSKYDKKRIHTEQIRHNCKRKENVDDFRKTARGKYCTKSALKGKYTNGKDYVLLFGVGM